MKNNYKNYDKIIYHTNEISTLLNISMSSTYRLLKSKQFPVFYILKTKVVPVIPFHKWVEKHYPNVILPKYNDIPPTFEKAIYSVSEIGNILSLKRTNTYKLINSGIFETVTIDNYLNVIGKSFNQWFHSQNNMFSLDKEEL